MIKAIIVDYGGVLSVHGRFRPYAEFCAKKYHVDADEFKDLIDGLYNKARVSELPSSSFWNGLAEKLGIAPSDLKSEIIDFFGFRDEMLEILKKLKKNYKLGLLSNQDRDWLETVVKEHGLDKIFDAIVGSYEVRIAKPDSRIYQEIMKRLKVKGEECLFVDDLEKNIPAAQQLGMKTILFTDVASFLKALKMYQVNM